MKIIRLQAANLKNLRAIDITPEPDSSVVDLSGPNGAGKSSTLDAIQWVMSGEKGAILRPIRDGEERAEVTVELGDGTTTELIVTRSVKEGQRATLTVESADGARFPSPQHLLEGISGALTFDPEEFSRMTARAQLEQLKELVKLDVDIDQLDRLNAHDYSMRTEINRQAKSVAERVHTLANRVGSLDLPEKEIDIDGLLGQMEGASKFNVDIEREEQSRAVRRSSALYNLSVAITKREQAAMLLREADEIEHDANADIAEINALPILAAPRETGALRTQIEEARTVNDRIRIRSEWLVAKASREELERESDALTEKMETRTRQKIDAISNAKMPVEGLSFGDGMVLFNGVPLSQASAGQKIVVALEIAMAANPKVRVILIRNASLLDETSLRLVAERAAARGYQVWQEFVDTSGKVGIVFEDGAITKVNKPQFPFNPAPPPDEERMAAIGARNERRAQEVGL